MAQKVVGRSALLEYIDTKENKAADALSHGRLAVAEQELGRLGVDAQRFAKESKISLPGVLLGASFEEVARKWEKEVRAALREEDWTK